MMITTTADLAEALDDIREQIAFGECVEDAVTLEQKALARAKEQLLVMIFELQNLSDTNTKGKEKQR